MKNTEDKYKLIFGFNNKSPLFARVANDYLIKGEYEEAKKILEAGLQLYPDYPASYFVYGLCLSKLGDNSKACEMIEKGGEFVDSSETVTYYLNKIQKIPDQKNPKFDDSSNSSSKKDAETSAETDMDDLTKLAQQLENAKITIDENTEVEFEQENEMESQSDVAGKPLVSETLAEIYFSQGNYKEALALYQNLISIQPEREQFYQIKINQIKKLLE